MRSWTTVCFVSLFLLAALSCGTSKQNPAAGEGKGQEIKMPNEISATPAQWVSGSPTAAAEQPGRPGPSGTTGEKTPGAVQEENPDNIKPYSENPLKSNPGDGPAIAIDATTVHVGVVMEGAPATCTYTVHNLGKKDLNILSVQPG